MAEIHGIELGELGPDEHIIAAGVAARGMRDNPSSVALFGTDPARRVRGLEPMYHWMLSAVERPPLVARRRGIIVGLAALSPPDRCFFRQAVNRQKTMRIGRLHVGVAVPAVPGNLFFPLLGLGPRSLGRMSTWGESSLRHDPPERHHHVELVVVEAALQGMGIGGVMMKALCAEMDKRPIMSYLETDKRENVRFYEHFGFEVTSEATILETQVWYMERRVEGGFHHARTGSSGSG